MAWTANKIGNALGWAWVDARSEYSGLCICHESSGTHQSNAGIKDNPAGGIVFHCFSGCTYEEFVAELLNRGIVQRKNPGDDRKKSEVCRYSYQDQTGHTVYQVVRYQPKDFRVVRLDHNGKQIWSLKDLDHRVIYNLPTVNLAKTTDPQKGIFLTEGEKDADTVSNLGLVSTCIAGGVEGWSKFKEDYQKQLRGHNIIILCHNDAPGQKFAGKVQADLANVAKSCRIVNLPGLPDHGDVTDWVKAGGTYQQLLDLCKPQPHDLVEIGGNELKDMQFKPIRWLASGFLHEGMILLGGKSKRGKSWVMLNLAMSVATGGDAFGYYEVPEPTKVLYCALEDGMRRTARRINMVDQAANLENLTFAFKMPPLVEGGIEYITEHIKQGYGLIVVDVLAHIESAGRNGMKDYHEVYKMFAPLQELRSRHSFAIVMVTHLKKAESEEVFDNLHGSVAYQGAQDALWVMERAQGEETCLIHIRDKDSEDKVVELKFDGAGIWSFIGEGEEHAEGKFEMSVINYLLEEGGRQGCSVKELIIGLDWNASVPTCRRRLQRMCSKNLIIRTERGKYIALRDIDTYGIEDPY